MHPLPSDRSRAYEAFVREHGEALLRYLRRRADPQVVDDVFAETMLVVWRRFDDIPDESLPWLHVTARNCLRNAERAARRQWRVAERITAVDPPRETTDAAGDDDPRSDLLHAALARLSRTDAEVLRLWAWEDLSAPEIATVMNISVNAATIRLHRAKKKLRHEMDAARPPARTMTEGGGR